jgi:hypothetical protein
MLPMHYRLMLLVGVAALGPVSTGARAEAVPPPPGSFTIVVLPDTQYYSESYPQIYLAQTTWIRDHCRSHNIKYVLHLGDVTDNNNLPQWDNAKAAMSVLDGHVPYAIAPGNHDYGPDGNGTTRATSFNDNAYFGPQSAYGRQPTIGGFYEAGKTDNSYHTFSAGGRDWLVIAAEFGPRNGVAAWIDRVLSEHPDRTAIFITHAHVYCDDTRYDWQLRGNSQQWNPHTYGIARDPDGTNDGQELWDKVFSKHRNMAMILNGHVLHDGTGRLTSVGSCGQVVHEMLANYQMITKGGNGYLRLLEIQPDGKTIHVRTYSPYLDAYNTAADQQFTIGLVDDPIEKVHSRAVLADRPLLYYRLETQDSAQGVENLGTAGARLAGRYSGPGPRASQFDAAGSCVQTAAAVPDMGRWSIAAWVRPDVVDTRQTILSNDRPGWHDDVLFGLGPDGENNATTPGHWGLSHQDDDDHVQTVVEAGTSAVAGRWYHLVASCDGETLRLYVDGELAGEAARTTGDLDFGGHLLCVGRSFEDADGGRPLRGTIAEVALFDKALSISQVTAHRLAAFNRVTAGNIVVEGPTSPRSNTVGPVTVPEHGFPGVGTLLRNRGDIEIAIGGKGANFHNGVLLASVTQNARDGLCGTVEVGRNNFKTTGVMCLSLAQAGSAEMKEININAAVAWFPFSGGWEGAHVDADGTVAAAGGVTQSMLKPDPGEAGRYTLDLGVDSRNDGMLFAIGGGNGNQIVLTGVPPDGSGWDIRVQANAAGFHDAGTAKPFSFVYVPYDTPNLTGGRYDGAGGVHLRSTGKFTMARVGPGRYRLSISGQSPQTGMLLLGVSRQRTDAGRTAPDAKFLTYEAAGQDFVIHSHDLPSLELKDTEFVWAFVGF